MYVYIFRISKHQRISLRKLLGSFVKNPRPGTVCLKRVDEKSPINVASTAGSRAGQLAAMELPSQLARYYPYI